MKPAKGTRQLARERVQLARRFEASVKQKRRRTPAGATVTTITTANVNVEIVASAHFTVERAAPPPPARTDENWI